MIKPRHPHREADAKGAIEDEMVYLDVIDGWEALGYRGEGREEYSGENTPCCLEEEDELANNREEELVEVG